MRAPGFWRRDGVLPRLLSPLGRLYAAGTARRLARGPRVRLGVPVVCVGNLTAGGTGKTPTAIWVRERLAVCELDVHTVSRGHGGSQTGPLRVDPARHGAEAVGDEPLLLAAFGPAWIGRDRLAAARAAVAAGAGAVVLDDGFQNAGLRYDLSIVVVDAGAAFGNGRCIPAGPLREPVDRGLARADLLLSIGTREEQAAFAALGPWPLPHLTGRLAPLPTGLPAGMPVLAFAGIGRPQKFFDTLAAMGLDLRGTRALADHQPLTPAILTRLTREARGLGAQLVTTEKDAVRLPPALRAEVLVVPVRLQIDDAGPLDAALGALGSG